MSLLSKSMHLWTISLLSLTVFCLLSADVFASRVIYRFNDSAAGNQGDYSISGTISFDSACGTACTPANVVSYDLSASSPKGDNFQLSSSAGDEVEIDNPLGAFLDVTSGGVTVHATSGMSDGFFRLIKGDNVQGPPPGPVVEWASDRYSGKDDSGATAWDHVISSPTTVEIVTVIPEPTCLQLLVVLVLAGSSRRRL